MITCWYKVLKGHLAVSRVNGCSKNRGRKLVGNYGKLFSEKTIVSSSREADVYLMLKVPDASGRPSHRN